MTTPSVVTTMKRAGCMLSLLIGVAACSSGGHRAATPPSTPSAKPEKPPASITAASVPMQQFAGDVHVGLSFDHPAAWRESMYQDSGSFYDLIVYVSNQRLHAPCATTHTGKGILTTCGEPISRLTAGGVLVSWGNVGFPHVGPEIPHPNARIDGRPATIEIQRPGDCGRIGGDETITADIARPHGNHFEMVACLRSPNVPDNETLVRRMLAMTKVTA